MLGALGRRGWASGWTCPTRQVLAPAGVRQHGVTPLWLSSPPAPWTRAAPGAGPLHPRFRRRGLARAQDSGAAAPGARGVWPGPRGPVAAPGLAPGGGGGCPAGAAAPPRTAKREQSGGREAEALPRRAARKALPGREGLGGWQQARRSSPAREGAAPTRGSSASRSPESRTPSAQAKGGSRWRR